MEIGKYSNDYPARGSFACRITFAKKSRIIDSQRQPGPRDTVFENHRKKSHSTLQAKRAMFTI